MPSTKSQRYGSTGPCFGYWSPESASSPTFCPSFFLYAWCLQQKCSFHVSGIAAKATVILGLHDVVDCQDDDRLGVLLSVRNLDILSSFILGKPKNLPTIRLSIVEINAACGESKAMFTAITNACDLLEDIVDTMVRNNNILHVPTAQNLLRQLPQWIQALPLNIQQLWNTFQRDHNLKEVDQQALMGILHISSVYYFTAILITRPFMVAYLLSRLRGKAPDHLINAPDQASDVNIKNRISVYLSMNISTLQVPSGFDQEHLFWLANYGNRAWVFGAGLVLGFAQFAGEPRKDINDSFDHACAILADIAPVSPQAQVYHEILCSFSQAVQRYKQRVADEAHQAVHQYIERIFRLGPAPVPQHCFSETPLIGDPFKSAAMNTQLDVSMDSLQDMDGLHALLDMARTNDQYDAWLGDIDYLVPDFGDFEQLFYTIG
ncbi:hypothetical protein UA08_00852 [Talaromyces atroroseus]|uniref:Transcription factor domain-containing protein n=1 Tax=Talaromyces atroroseus TaxID=1441469 RepID=A0A225B140_TALAT|nr:hypothetical protein UA08_00852 [Talaromyces atroroseus]OKL64424.1 hypothetical protein UA08_00852 [Talaromyces atroroseus]